MEDHDENGRSRLEAWKKWGPTISKIHSFLMTCSCSSLKVINSNRVGRQMQNPKCGTASGRCMGWL
ncbi:hypothetical protein QQP08_008892 [Theobroma cacao]|nr:hypothetical protein QQP08_008892 [Theobroma cacao]